MKNKHKWSNYRQQVHVESKLSDNASFLIKYHQIVSEIPRKAHLDLKKKNISKGRRSHNENVCIFLMSAFIFKWKVGLKVPKLKHPSGI